MNKSVTLWKEISFQCRGHGFEVLAYYVRQGGLLPYLCLRLFLCKWGERTGGWSDHRAFSEDAAGSSPSSSPGQSLQLLQYR